MAECVGVVVVSFVVVTVVALADTDIVLLTWIVAAVVVLDSMTFDLLFTVAIVTIPAAHIATSVTNQIANL